MFKNMKIGIKLLIVLLVMSLGTLLVISISSYANITSLTDEFQKANISQGLTASDDSKEALQDQAEEYVVKIADKQTESMNQELLAIRTTIQEAAEYIERLYADSDNMQGRDLPLPDETEAGVASSKYMLAPGVESTEELQAEVRLLSNCEYMFAPTLANNSMLDNMYVGTVSGISYRYSSSNLYDETYDPRSRDWYKKAMESVGTAIWLDTYLDSYGNMCITCSETFADADGSVIGVVAADIALQDMLNDISSVKIGESGYSFVLDSTMNYIAHPNYFDNGFETDVRANETDSQSEAWDTIENDDSGIVEMDIDGVNSYVAFATLQETGWKLCVSINQEEIVAPAVATKEKIDTMTDEMQETIRAEKKSIMVRYIIIFAIVGIVVNILSFMLAGNITRPIQKLAHNVSSVGEGNFDIAVEVESNDEVGQLASSFNLMLGQLKQYIENLTQVTAEKERIGAELDVATQIQTSMLPYIFPAFPEWDEFDIYATMTPAKEVGGDFYDFFLVDENHLALVMADVSGKSVPAAMFMMTSKTMIKISAQSGLSPKEVLEKVNDQLCENNEAEMFVTVWLGILDIPTGKMVCANAGHEYPAIRKANGEFELYKDKHGFVLAGMEGVKYREYEVQLDPGDTIFVYTDGVAEATDSQNQLYGTDRMLAALNKEKDASPKKILENMSLDIARFVGDAEQFDDITMLALKML